MKKKKKKKKRGRRISVLWERKAKEKDSGKASSLPRSEVKPPADSHMKRKEDSWKEAKLLAMRPNFKRHARESH